MKKSLLEESKTRKKEGKKESEREREKERERKRGKDRQMPSRERQILHATSYM